MTTYVLFIVSGEINLPQKRSLGLERYHAVTTAKEIYESRERSNMLCYAYTASLVRFVERRVVFSFFTVKCVLSVKTLRFYGLIFVVERRFCYENRPYFRQACEQFFNQVYVSF